MKNMIFKNFKKSYVLIVLICLGVISCVSTKKATNVGKKNSLETNRIIVSKDKTGDYSSITEAIKNWKSNQKIFIKNGHYIENITLKEGMEIIGEDNKKTIIDGNNDGWVIKAANNSKIENLKVINSGSKFGINDAGIMIDKIYGCEINNNIITKNGHYGIIIRESECTISNNTIYKNKVLGIYVDASTNIVISKNQIFSHKHSGINIGKIIKNTNLLIKNNQIYNNILFGIYHGSKCIDEKFNISIIDNQFKNINKDKAIYFFGKCAILEENNIVE